jgi:hypothetical protein
VPVPSRHPVTAITPADLPSLVRMLDDLAEYEEVTAPVQSTVQSQHAAMFGLRPILSGFIARKGGEPACHSRLRDLQHLCGYEAAVHRGLVRECRMPQ